MLIKNYVDTKPEALRELALFAGGGGGILGGLLLGWRTVCAVEIAPYAREVLVARQNDGCLPPFPIWDDVQTFDGKPWRGLVDVISGGFPCQDISCAGKGAGIGGERSGLWGEMARIIGEVRPRYAFVENSPMLVHRGLARVIGDLAEMGYDARWGVLSAGDVTAPHRRERLFLVSHAAGISGQKRLGRPANDQSGGLKSVWWKDAEHHAEGYRGIRLETESLRPRVVNGVAVWVDRLKAIGNGQVPAVARLAWETLSNF